MPTIHVCDNRVQTTRTSPHSPDSALSKQTFISSKCLHLCQGYGYASLPLQCCTLSLSAKGSDFTDVSQSIKSASSFDRTQNNNSTVTFVHMIVFFAVLSIKVEICEQDIYTFLPPPLLSSPLRFSRLVTGRKQNTVTLTLGCSP